MKKEIIIIYHADCPDGFGGAFAAWEKFGDSAYYHPAINREKPEIETAGKEVYIIDFCYPKEILAEIEREAKKLVILDHHISAKEAVESVYEHVFDNNKSGSAIAWEYFHPRKPLPKLLAYVQDGDLWRFALPNSKEIGIFLGTINFDFSEWKELADKFEDEKKFSEYAKRGEIYSEYFNIMCRSIANKAELVEFEGYRVYTTSAPKIFRSEVGHILANKQPPFAILWYISEGKWQFSMRGDGTIDLTNIAVKYGGGGHKNAAAFRLPLSSPLPWKMIDSPLKKR